MKGIGLLRKLQSILPRTSLLTIYKSFIRPHLDCGDEVHDQPSNDDSSNKPKTVQHSAALAVVGAINGTSREKPYQELGLEYLQQRRWMRQLCLFYKVVSTKLPAYIYDMIPPVAQFQRHPNTFKTRLKLLLTSYRFVKDCKNYFMYTYTYTYILLHFSYLISIY